MAKEMIIKYWRITQVLFLAAGLTACSMLHGMSAGGSRDEVAPVITPPAPPQVMLAAVPAIDPDAMADLQLKMTRLVARTEELEEKFSRQQERLQIIERGLTLGIVPDELQGQGKNNASDAKVSKGSSPSRHARPIKPGKASKPSKGQKPVDMPIESDLDSESEKEDNSGASISDEDESSVAASDPAKAAGVPVVDREEFNKAFAASHEDFRAGRFGKAIVGFSEIGKRFDPSLTSGIHQFWIARSWAGLKEMQTARQLFTEFIAARPDSPWAPRAKLELARVESALGLKETAIKRLRGVIAEHPLEDVSEMARAEVERMSKTL